MGKSTSNKSTPSTSRKDLRTSAPYRRSREPEPAAGAPLAKVKLVPAAPPATAPPPAAAPVPPAVTQAAAPPPADFLAALQTSLAFASAALAALPHPADIAAGDPTAAEPPPGPAPAGDARSLRSGDQFALVYRHGAAVISRRGTVGQRGAWRVVDYPSANLAAHAYALECSRLAAQGYRDLQTRSS